MFTGLVETIGHVIVVRTVAGGRRLTVDAGCAAEGTAPGASVSVNGVCLTVSGVEGPRLDFDVIAETVGRSNLGSLRAGDRVNLERSLRPDTRLHGHFVQGHVDGTATIRRKQSTGGEHVIWFEPQPPLAAYIVPKGSIAIDGISLTIADVRDGRFSVALIPATIENTTLWIKQVGDAVNVETDVLVRTVVHCLRQMQSRPDASGVTFSKLQEHGFA